MVTIEATGRLASGAAWSGSASGALSDETHGKITFEVRPRAAPPEFPTLTAAYEAIREPSDYDIVVHDGIYPREVISWSPDKTFAHNTVRVVAGPGERPVFDGTGTTTSFVSVWTSFQRGTNLVFDALTIRNYQQAFSLKGGNDSRQWGGNNTIQNCVMSEIGDRRDDGSADSWGAMVWEYQRENLVQNNVFYDVYNDAKDHPGQIHAIYLSHGSSRNTIRNNFVHNGSHDPFRFRDGANDNVVVGNYVDRAGGWAPVTRYRETYSREQAVSGNQIQDNLFLYGQGESNLTSLVDACFDNPGGGSHEVTCGADEFQVDSITRQFLRYTRSSVALDVSAVALGDFDGDGRTEAVAAMASVRRCRARSQVEARRDLSG
jgi:hypothetical protein